MSTLIALSPILFMMGLALLVGVAFFYIVKRSRPEPQLEKRVAALEAEIRKLKESE